MEGLDVFLPLPLEATGQTASYWSSGQVVTPGYLWCKIAEAFSEAKKICGYTFVTQHRWGKFWCCFHLKYTGTQIKSCLRQKERMHSWSVRQLSERLQEIKVGDLRNTHTHTSTHPHIHHGCLVMSKQGTFHWQHVFNKTFVHMPEFSLPMIFMGCVSQCY